MQRDIILKKLQTHKHELQKQGIRQLGLFGSYVRNEASATSDIDLLVEIEGVCGLIRFSQLQRYISDLLNQDVDLVTIDALHPALKDSILHEVIYV